MLPRIFARRFESVDVKPAVHDGRLEGLRGMAAVSVMFVHGIGDEVSRLGAPNEYVRHLHFSRVAVLLFFILSGYVIGLTNQGGFSAHRAKVYVGRRALRLLPVYLLAIAAGWLVATNVSPGNVIANLLFLQNDAWGIAPLAGNRPVWSLHYEVIYYASFLCIWKWRPGILPVFCLLSLSTLGDWFLGGVLSLPGGWSAGALFWLSGLAIAWSKQGERHTPLVPYLLLAFATQHLWPGAVLLRGLGFPYAGNAAVWLSDLIFLPVALVIFSATTRKDIPGLVVLKWLSFMIPVSTCGLLLVMGRLGENVPWRMSAIALLLALPWIAMNDGRFSSGLLKVMQPVGRISYGLYLLHYPAAILTAHLYPWSGTLINYVGGIAIWIILSVFAASLAEVVLQPRLRSIFKTNRPVMPEAVPGSGPGC